MDIKEYKNVLIGGPIQNREWILDEWLDAILKSDYPHDKMAFAWLVNNSTDKTYEMLKEWQKKHENRFRDIRIWTANGNWKDNRFAGRWFSYFAELRNLWLTMRTPEDEVIISLDSDIVIREDTVSRLLEWDLPITAGLIPNGIINNGPLTGQMSFNFMELFKTDEDGRTYYIHKPLTWLVYKEFEQSPGRCPREYQVWDNETGIYTSCERFSGPVPVDMTGAIFAIQKEVLDAPGVEFGYHWQGEDCYFCERAIEAGFQCYLDRMVLPAHIMSEEMYEDYKMDLEERKKYRMVPLPPRSFEEQQDVPVNIKIVKKD